MSDAEECVQLLNKRMGPPRRQLLNVEREVVVRMDRIKRLVWIWEKSFEHKRQYHKRVPIIDERERDIQYVHQLTKELTELHKQIASSLRKLSNGNPSAADVRYAKERYRDLVYMWNN